MAGQVNGIALAAVGAGAMFVYSGLTGRSVLGEVQALIQGKSAGSVAQTLGIGGVGSGGVLGASGSVSVSGSPNQTQWAKDLLSALGAPQTSANVQSVVAWQNREGGGGANNPLNTTLPMPGSSSFNSVGVQNYTSPSQGLQATVETLRTGPYGDILMALLSGQGLLGRSFAGLSTWSGGGYSSV